LLAGCQSAGTGGHYLDALPPSAPGSVTITNTLNPDLLKPPVDLFTLGPGDQLDIEILGANNTHATTTVGLDGKIYYSLLPGVDVWGLTLAQAKLRLERELGNYIKPPQVSVSLRAVGSKYVWLLGRLNKPGIYAISGPMTLLEAMAQAGGTAKSTSSVTTQDLADLRHSFVMRDGHPLPVDFVRLLQEGDMSQNIYLKPGDFVFIPSSLSQEVYVLGAVVTPRTVPYSDLMNVVSAIAGANGPAVEAYTTHVAIVRGSLSQPQIIEVNYKAIIKGEAPNVTLEPGDIVYVPLSPYRFLTEYADLIVTTFVRAWTANEGIRAVSGSTGSTGVSVPIGGH
jgi:protein involved in polysaccharide export with SLBB domain